MAWLDGWRKYITTFLDESKWGEEHPVRNNTPVYPRPAQSAASLPRNLKRLREVRGLSITALAAESGVSASTIRGIEQGRGTCAAPDPLLTTMLKLAHALGVSVAALVEEGGEG